MRPWGLWLTLLLGAWLAAQQPVTPPHQPAEPGGKAAGAATAEQNPAAPAPAMPMSQSAMATEMHASLRMMMQMGRLARRQGATIAVRRYGDRIARDAAVADRMLYSRASALGMHLSMAPPDVSSLQPWMNQSGSSFDQRFLTMMAARNAAMIRMLSAAAASGGQSPMMSLVRKMLPVVRVHWQLAQALLKPGAPV